jgi:diguanylate cyclase (GGDEF)-like protein
MQMAELISLFRSESTQRLADMAAALELLEADPANTAALETLARRFHSFAGVGLEGLEVITTLGGRGEIDCRRFLSEGKTAAAEQLRKWRSLMDVLRLEVDNAEASVAIEAAPPATPARRIYEVSADEEAAGGATIARILSVEDDVDQAAYLRGVLESGGYEVRSCGDPHAFESDLLDFAPDLILMDILLPEVSGYELARIARQNDEHQTTPILFLTTQGQLHTRIQSMRSGGDDHIVKPVSPTLLLAAVESRVERARQIRRFLDHDNLTGLLNRAAFMRKVKARIRRGGDRPASLVILDVDRFKRINDTYGHGQGDQVLSRLATFLRARVRTTDSVCRYGGEEFTMLIDDATELDALHLVDRLREEYASTLDSSSGTAIRTTFSGGVVALPHEMNGIARALEAADAALYRAKAEGRNRVYQATRYPVRISA